MLLLLKTLLVKLVVISGFYLNNLKIILSVTDGGPLQLHSVNFIKEDVKKIKLPGMHVLSYYKSFNTHRAFESKPLANINWKSLFDHNVSPDLFPDAGSLAAEHVTKKIYYSKFSL